MPRRLYIPFKVKEDISNHLHLTIAKAVDGYVSACEDEDAMTGHLGGLLRIKNKKVVVPPRQQEEIWGVWTWSLDYYKFRGRGKGATETYLGADGLFEFCLNIGNRKETKSLLFQSKLDWNTDSNLLAQSIKLSTWREAAFVINYTHKGFQAILIDDAIKSKGKYSEKVIFTPLERFLDEYFIACLIGDTELKYDARSRKLFWRSMNGQKVCTNFSTNHRFRLNVNAPRRPSSAHIAADIEISPDEIHNYRMSATEEEILSLAGLHSEVEAKNARKTLALTYHPDKFNGIDEYLESILNRRMGEVNEAYEYVRSKKHT